jgi:hypothetical protein
MGGGFGPTTNTLMCPSPVKLVYDSDRFLVAVAIWSPASSLSDDITSLQPSIEIPFLTNC